MTAILLILSTLGTAPNDPPTVSAGEVLVCQFEEATDRDYDGWPDGWVRRRSRQLPEFLKIGIVPEPTSANASLPSSAATPADAATSGVNHCLQIELDGGGAVMTSPPCAVSPQFSLLLSVRMKTVW